MKTKFNIDNSGNLHISVDSIDELKEWLNEQSESNDETLFINLIEDKLCNGYHLVWPEQVGALTDSLLITDLFFEGDETTDDERENANVWYYNDYQIKSYLKDLLETGKVLWHNSYRSASLKLKVNHK